MSASVAPEALWHREDGPPAWWSRSARVAYGVLVLEIGALGTSWATTDEDEAGLAISGALQVIACGVIAAALLGAGWPRLARALTAARGSLHAVWVPTASLCARACTRAAHLLAAAWLSMSTAFAHGLVRTGHLAAAMWRPIATTTAPALTATGHLAISAYRLTAVAVAKGVAAAGHLIVSVWHPVASATVRVLIVASHLIATAWHPIAWAATNVVVTTARLVATAWRPAATITGRSVGAAGRLLTTVGRPISAGIATTFTAAGHLAAAAWMRRPLRLSKTLTPTRVALVVVELFLVGTALGFGYIWGWWFQGDRMTGQVLEVYEADYTTRMTVLDPATELPIEVAHVTFGLGTIDVGDTATVVMMRSDPSKVTTPTTLLLYLALWMVLPLAALAWPVGWWRSLRHRSQSWEPVVAAGSRVRATVSDLPPPPSPPR